MKLGGNDGKRQERRVATVCFGATHAVHVTCIQLIGLSFYYSWPEYTINSTLVRFA